MILFDNIYYLLYNYFLRTNSGRYGYKFTSISITSLYIYLFVCLLVSLINIFYCLIIIDASNTFVLQNSSFSTLSKDFIIFGSFICLTFTIIRYYTFKNINVIYEKINDMDMKKRERLNVLSVSYMVTSPFLLFFLVNFLKNLYR